MTTTTTPVVLGSWADIEREESCEQLYSASARKPTEIFSGDSATSTPQPVTVETLEEMNRQHSEQSAHAVVGVGAAKKNIFGFDEAAAEETSFSHHTHAMSPTTSFRSAGEAESEGHASRISTHNPYSLTNVMLEHQCECQRCSQPSSTPRTTSPMSVQAANILADSPAAGVATATTGNYYYNQPQEAVEQQAGQQPVMEAEGLISTFMPPPPPSPVTNNILAQGGNRDADADHYRMMMRWYERVLRSQVYFIQQSGSEGDDGCWCPSPHSGGAMSFFEWAHACQNWWFRNFEHMQTKRRRFPKGFYC